MIRFGLICMVFLLGSIPLQAAVLQPDLITLDPVASTGYCPGSTLSVTFSTDFALNGDNEYTLELSDAAGSFADSTVIGTLASTGMTGVTIDGLIPVTISPGTQYRVRVTSSSPASVSADNGDDIEIFIRPSIIEVVLSKTNLCANDSMQFTAVLSGGTAPYSYLWNNGTLLNDSTIKNPVFNPDSSGQYSFSVIASDSNSCFSDTAVTSLVQVFELPSVSIFADIYELCLGDSTQFSAMVTGGDISLTGSYDYQWTPSTDIDNDTLPDPYLISAQTGENKFTLKVSDDNTCTRISDTLAILVNALPEVSFSGLNADHAYCVADSTIQLSGFPVGTAGLFQGSGVTDHGDGSATYNVLSAVDSLGTSTVTTFHDISYSYTNAKGCKNSMAQTVRINPLPSVNITGFNSEPKFCANDTASVLLKGIPQDSAGIFSGYGITDNLDGTAYYNVKGVLDQFEITDTRFDSVQYVYTDINGCTSFYSQEVEINPFPILQISNIKPEFCENEGVYILSGAPQGGVFTGPGIIDSIRFDPSIAGAADHLIAYSYTNEKGCENKIDTTITVFPEPVADFTFINNCDAKPIQFFDQSTIENDSIIGWNWDFVIASSTEQNPVQEFDNRAQFVTLSVESQSGCADEKSQFFIPRNIPVPQFTFENTCFNDAVLFKSLTDYTGYGNPEYFWSFTPSDSIVTLSDTVSYTFIDTGQHPVVLKVKIDDCTNTDSSEVVVQPLIDQFPSMENFDNGPNWYSNGIDGSPVSWAYDLAGNTNIPDRYAGNKIWFTNITVAKNENSWVKSPCYDLSKLKRPMLSLDFWNDTNPGQDGAVLQVSTDGKTWENLGDKDNGKNWFNADRLLFEPGGNTNLGDVGWSGKSGWTNARQILDKVLGAPRVMFRIAFGRGDKFDLNGFAFDNFTIKERTHKVLVENFLNITDQTSFQARRALDEMYDMNIDNNDTIIINYHPINPLFTENTGTEGAPAANDPFNVLDYRDPSARKLFYKISTIPVSIVDGISTDRTIDEDSSFSTDIRRAIDRRLLTDDELKLDIDFPGSQGPDDSLKFTVNIEATGNLDLNNYVLHTLVQKDLYPVDTLNYYNVLVEMLPDASGIPLVNNRESYAFNWDPAIVNLPGSIGVVAFIQNINTKEIVYSVYRKAPEKNIVSGLDKSLNTAMGVRIYPNPVSDFLNIDFDKEHIMSGYWGVFDINGSRISSGTWSDVDGAVHIDVSGFSNGVYLICLYGHAGVITRKFIVAGH